VDLVTYVMPTFIAAEKIMAELEVDKSATATDKSLAAVDEGVAAAAADKCVGASTCDDFAPRVL
jgi:hypothetical protein